MFQTYEQLASGARMARDRVDHVRVDRDNLESSLYDLKDATKGLGNVVLELLETLKEAEKKKER